MEKRWNWQNVSKISKLVKYSEKGISGYKSTYDNKIILEYYLHQNLFTTATI